MFQKRITLNDFDEMVFQLDDHNFATENVADKADTVVENSDYSISMQKKLKSELTTTFRAFKVPHAKLKQKLRNRIEEICCGSEYDSQILATYYLFLLILSHKNLPAFVAALAHFKNNDYLFTPKIYLKHLPDEAKTKAPSTVYEITNQFLMQMVHFDYLIKVDKIYKVKNIELNYEQQEFAEKVIAELPEQYQDDLKVIFKIEEIPEQTLNAI